MTFRFASKLATLGAAVFILAAGGWPVHEASADDIKIGNRSQFVQTGAAAPTPPKVKKVKKSLIRGRPQAPAFRTERFITR